MTKRREIALITGASRGIGLELALVFGRNGFELTVVAGSESELERLERGGKVLCSCRASK